MKIVSARMVLSSLLLVGLLQGCKSSPPKVAQEDILVSGAVDQPGYHRIPLSQSSSVASIVERAGGVHPKGLRDHSFAATLVFENNRYPRQYLPAKAWNTSFKKLGVDPASCTEVRVERRR